ncbi:MAG: leucine-rich repeat protein [Bacteroidaceae bacterium]|nr:leucine-rich repeat protein [Bacteroidaceae bacterium]
MKKTLLFLLVLCASLYASANPITREQAQERAERFLSGLPGGSKNLSPVRNRAKLAPRRGTASTASEQDLYYVFNRGENQGYVIATGDDSTFPVIGYTDQGEFDYAQLPENMKAWLESCSAQLQNLAEHPELAEANASTIRRIPTHPAIAPLCTSKWSQGSPYNDECPIYTDGRRSVTGCVATAMAQVLYYHRAKSVTEVQKDIPAYTTNGLKVAGIEAGAPIDWDNMVDNYGGSTTGKQKLAVAQLMHYCGVSVEMAYTSSSSGAYSSMVDDAFINYFGYSSNRVKYVSGNNYNDEAWDALLYAEIEASRPVYLSGSNESGGHAFVCDGYDGNRCFHINWGWGGSSDGYFMLNKLNPSSQGIGGSEGGYSDWPEAVIGVEPENYATRAMPITNTTVKKLCLENFDADGDGTFTYGEAAAITDLGDAFKGQRITTFTELYNFTGLTTLSESAFEGCTALTTVKLPKQLKNIGTNAFKGCTLLKTFALPQGLQSIGDHAFDGCKAFVCTLPAGLREIGAYAFSGCAALKEMDIPISVKSIGEGAFKGCTKLTEVTLRSNKPTSIELGSGIFADVDLTDAVLNAVQGSKTTLQATEQWKDFGTIYEMRDLSRGRFANLETGKQYFIYNVGTGRYLTRGEAWGTQAIVAETDSPMRFEFKRYSSMPDGVYYLYSNDTGSDTGHITFRTASDAQVGNGVKAAFVDGSSSNITNKTSWWNLALVEGESNIYTFQIPSNVSGYNAAQYWGVQPDHNSNVASPTYGVYSDVTYANYAENCQWMLVEYDEQATAIYLASQQLQNLLGIAATKRMDATREQAVYDNLESTAEELVGAQRRLRKKLGFIHFNSDAVREVIMANNVDSDGDGEVTPSEAANVSSLETIFFSNKDITSLTDLRYFTGLEALAGNSFKDCFNLVDITLPDNLMAIYYRAFMNCSKLTAVNIPVNVEGIGDDAFNGCTSLREVHVSAADPSQIVLGSDVFQNVDLASATLYVPYGSKEAYSNASIWQDFGTIIETRALGKPGYSPLAENEDVYVINLGMHRYIQGGEAYGTQAVVGSQGYLYQLRRTASMPADTYYLYATSLGTSKNILFRTDTDSKVGNGVKACFVDGSVSAKAYWKVAPVEGLENVYTFQVPDNQSDYVEGEYLGVDPENYYKSDFTYYTSGLYYDIMYDGNEAKCQWAFISKAELDSLQNFYALTEQLKDLIVKADAKSIDTQAERAIYDDFSASELQVANAIATLRSKLHYIDFSDNYARTICINTWDDDEDDELSMEEAAAVTDLGTAFRSSTGITSFEELRYFTGLTHLTDNAFRACSNMKSIYLPANITSLGESCFTSCSKLEYVALLSPTQLDITGAGLTVRNLTAFVPAALVDTYSQSADWERATIKEYTGTPTVTASDGSRQYGRTNPKFTYEVSGAPINGEPVISAEQDKTAPVGDYPVVIEAGTITSPNLQLCNGTLTIEPATVTIASKSCTRNVGEPNPEFEIVYPTFRNREKAEDVLLHEAVCECDATPESPAGVYEIRVSGAEAQNYTFEYVFGKLTVVDPTGVSDMDADSRNAEHYDLSGRKVSKPNRSGIYITSGKKKVAIR